MDKLTFRFGRHTTEVNFPDTLTLTLTLILTLTLTHRLLVRVQRE